MATKPKPGAKHLSDLGLAIACARAAQTPGQPWTLEEIACYAGVTRERIRQIEEKALRKICASPARRRMLEELLPGIVTPLRHTLTPKRKTTHVKGSAVATRNHLNSSQQS